MIYLGEIVIISGDPEYWNYGSPQAFFVKLSQAHDS